MPKSQLNSISKICRPPDNGGENSEKISESKLNFTGRILNTLEGIGILN